MQNTPNVWKNRWADCCSPCFCGWMCCIAKTYSQSLYSALSSVLSLLSNFSVLWKNCGGRKLPFLKIFLWKSSTALNTSNSSDKWSLFLVCRPFLFVTDVHASTYVSNLTKHNGLSLHTYILLQGFHFFFCTPWSCVVSSIDFFGLQLYRSIACSTVITRNLLAPFSSATRLATQYL